MTKDDQFLNTDEFNYEQYEYILDNYEKINPYRIEEMATEMMANIRNDKAVAQSKVMLSILFSITQYSCGDMDEEGINNVN